MTTSIDNPCMDFEINVGGTLNLLEAVRQYNSNCNIIYSSTNKVYGDLEQYKYNETEIIVLQTDYIVMSQKLSAADIIKYTVTMKIFGLMFFIYTAVLQALWPVCAELRVKMQWRKLHRIIFLNIIGGVFFIGLGTLFIYVLKDYIYSIIANGIDYNISEVVFVLLAVYFSIRVWCDTFAMLLQSMNQLKILWLIVPCQALIGGVTQWYFAEHYGIVGILYGLILSFSLTVFWGLPVYYMYKSKRLA